MYVETDHLVQLEEFMQLFRRRGIDLLLHGVSFGRVDTILDVENSLDLVTKIRIGCRCAQADSSPGPTSATAYDPYFYEGGGYWERSYLIYAPPRDVRVDLYDKDTLRSSVKVSIPNSNDVHVFDATVTEDGRLIVSSKAMSDQLRPFRAPEHSCLLGQSDNERTRIALTIPLGSAHYPLG